MSVPRASACGIPASTLLSVLDHDKAYRQLDACTVYRGPFNDLERLGKKQPDTALEPADLRHTRHTSRYGPRVSRVCHSPQVINLHPASGGPKVRRTRHQFVTKTGLFVPILGAIEVGKA